jgi:hypothetical protein
MFHLSSRDSMAAGPSPLQGQAADIIASIFADPSPDLDEVKRNLRRCVAAHPGAPELALLAHLMETSVRVNAEGAQRAD